MEKNKIPYEVLPERYGLHKLLDEWFDVAEKNSFVDGRKSAIEELMPHTVIYQKAAKLSEKAAKNKSIPPPLT